MARDEGIELLLIASLYIWSEVRTARKLAAVSAAAAAADPFTWDSLKKRAIDRGLDSIINLALP